MSVEMDPDHEQKKHKKSKSKRKQAEEENPADKMDIDESSKATTDSTKKEKKSKDKKRKVRSEDVELSAIAAESEPAVASPEKKHKRHKSGEDKDSKKEKKEKKSKHSSKRASTPDEATENDAAPVAATPKPQTSHRMTIPDTKEYPFFTQTFSQRVPIWPAAFDEPLTKTAREYLDPMLNRYSPKFKGVLLAYKNVNVSHRPQRPNPNDPPTDETPVALESFECYAPPFAWLTADLHLFVPSRGAWMEGEINLQSEGHIGVVCFEKFNASISRRSLPRGWKWVEQTEEEREAEEAAAVEEEDPFAAEAGEDEEKAEGEEGAEGEEEQEGEEGTSTTKPAKNLHRLRSSGYWLDENGDKVSGKVYFRIKNFSSGSTGDYTYLSLQGTMLDDEAEKEAAAEERGIEKARRARQNPSGLLYPTMRLPEFSMTKLKDDLI